MALSNTPAASEWLLTQMSRGIEVAPSTALLVNYRILRSVNTKIYGNGGQKQIT
jgi:hypothetical protein